MKSLQLANIALGMIGSFILFGVVALAALFFVLPAQANANAQNCQVELRLKSYPNPITLNFSPGEVTHFVETTSDLAPQAGESPNEP